MLSHRSKGRLDVSGSMTDFRRIGARAQGIDRPLTQRGQGQSVMTVSHPLVDLARDSSPEARARLAAHTAELFLNDISEAGSAQGQHYAAILSRLYAYARQDVRAKLSAALALSDWAPLELVRALAADSFEIAQPVISFCPVLDEQGLVDVVRTCGVEHRVCVAGRDNIGEAVTGALIEAREQVVIAALADNDSARIAPDSFARALDIVKDDARLVDTLVARPDLPASLVATAYALAGRDARAAIARRLPPGLEARLTRLAEIVVVEATEAQLESPLPGGLGPQVAHGVSGKTTPSARTAPTTGQILASLVRGERNQVLRGMAEHLGVPGPVLAKRLSEGSVEFLALVARAGGFEIPTVRALHDMLTSGKSIWSRDDERAVALTWMRTTPASARQQVRSVLGA
jgi:hypothetical protein